MKAMGNAEQGGSLQQLAATEMRRLDDAIADLGTCITLSQINDKLHCLRDSEGGEVLAWFSDHHSGAIERAITRLCHSTLRKLEDTRGGLLPVAGDAYMAELCRGDE
jgi:hypothetical protein